ncbi:glycosyltransferase [Nocardioides sp. BP30]|uniref:glycosyltransferase n=1 Tax=Nocardioides sp. BP30 TaxID=3036374 RepID=UPI0024691BCC|nr:glycosyltransferase [Nocardioides sp. BP30]WGL53685.1 glycosyltransferase [Nocardioides sp. BP30]
MTGEPRSSIRRLAGRGKRALRRRLGVTSDVPRPPLEPDVATLVESSLFDHEWYARQTGVQRSREASARHYLAEPRGVLRAHPHPLFDPEFYADALPDDLVEAMDETDPFVFYLRRRTWRRVTHPLFDTKGYLRRNKDARQYAGGALAHYAAVGVPAGLQPNDWLAADAEGRFPDLRAWLADRHEEWAKRAADIPTVWRRRFDDAQAERFTQTWADVSVPRDPDRPTVSVILDAGLDDAAFAATLSSVARQDDVTWELVVVDRGRLSTLAEALAEHAPGASVVEAVDDDLPEALNRAVDTASGRFVAFVRSGDIWSPGRLRLMAAVAERESAPLVADVLARTSPEGGARRYAVDGHPAGALSSRHAIDLARLLFSRALLDEVGTFDPAIPGEWDFDLVLRASQAAKVRLIPVIGVERERGIRVTAHRLPPALRPPVDPAGVPTWADVALNRRLIDWAELAGREQDPETVSVIIPTFHDGRMTAGAVESVLASDGVGGIRVQCIVWDNGSVATVSAELDALKIRFPEIVLVHSPVNHGFALGNNLALPYAVGATVVFLNNDTTVEPDWLLPLREMLADPGVLAAQSLLIYPTGAVQSGGVAFPSTGGIPHAFLRGFPVEDARGIEQLEFAALTGAALALRHADVVALHGFDPIFRNGMEDVDLCLRLRELRNGTFRVAGGSPVVHHESRSQGRYDSHLLNRRLYLDRWAGVAEPRDDVRLWASRGFRVIDHELPQAAPGARRDTLEPRPVLVRESKLLVRESAPRLRWAIKNPAPAGKDGEHWGDTHFARAVAAALRELDQEVVIDARGEFDRSTSRHDDVALVLRGLAPFMPSYEQVSIGWVISHPEMLSWSEASSYDRLVAASVPWAEDTSRRWGIRVDPLLQATDPTSFHPDRGIPDSGHPVIFVGGSRDVARPIVTDAAAARLPLSVYGHGWRPFIDKRFIKAEYLPNAELGEFYRRAGVVLNDHWQEMREQGFLSNRLFDAVASGARVITDDVAGLRDVFGSSVQVYRTPEDLTRLSSLADPDAVFGSDEERRAAAATIHREHSFLARGRQLLEIAVEERRRRGFA